MAILDFGDMGAFIELNGSIIIGSGGSKVLVSGVQDFKKDHFYFKSFFDSSYLQYAPERITIWEKKDLLKLLHGFCVDRNFREVSNADQIFLKDLDHFKKSSLEKVVLLTRQNYERGDAGLKYQLIHRALTFKNSLPYGFWDENWGMVGATPEILCHVKEENLETHAIASTVPWSDSESLSNEKFQHEHQTVVRDIQNKLESIHHHVLIGKQKKRIFGTMVHLETPMSSYPVQSLIEVVSTLSPTAALGGYPSEAALQYLKETDYSKKYSNRYYGSSLGFVTNEEALFIVAIRNVQWSEHEVFIESGAGIVQESDPQSELEEVQLKRQSVYKHYLCV